LTGLKVSPSTTRTAARGAGAGSVVVLTAGARGRSTTASFPLEHPEATRPQAATPSAARAVVWRVRSILRTRAQGTGAGGRLVATYDRRMGAVTTVGLAAGTHAKSVLEAIRSPDRFEVAPVVAGRRLMVCSRWCPRSWAAVAR
jgi:hypothetical protein